MNNAEPIGNRYTGPRGRQLRRGIKDDRIQAGIIALFFAVGVAGHVFVPAWMEILTPPVLWVYGILVLILSALSVQSPPDAARRRFLVWALITYLITFVLEAVGTKTGLVFGPYTYGNVLGLMLFSVPLVIGFNWVLVVLGALRVVQRLPFWPGVIAAACLTTGFDYLMEPVAIKLGYWTWHWDGIPLQNYIAWFVTSFIAALAFRLLKLRITSRLAAFYLLIQAVFFVLIRITA